MHIQVNTDNTIDGNEALDEHVEAELSRALARFESQLTRVEVHFSDEDGPRTGAADKSCRLEARPTAHRPLTVSHRGGSLDEALRGATDKLQRVLDSELGRRSQVKGGASIRPGR